MKKGEIVRATTGSHFDIPVIRSTRMTVCESPCERRLNPKLVSCSLPRLLRLRASSRFSRQSIRRFHEVNPAGANSNMRKSLYENCTPSQHSNQLVPKYLLLTSLSCIPLFPSTL